MIQVGVGGIVLPMLLLLGIILDNSITVCHPGCISITCLTPLAVLFFAERADSFLQGTFGAQGCSDKNVNFFFFSHSLFLSSEADPVRLTER